MLCSHGIPTLVVEILSEGNRKLDETIKRQRYEHYGIPEYWIIDPALDQIKIYRLVNGCYGQAAVLSLEAQELLTTPLLPTLTLPLATLFKEAPELFFCIRTIPHPFENRPSKRPPWPIVTFPHIDPDLHTLVWPNGADFSPEFLHDNVRVTA
ncbi:MAG: Uma2 family endonuclease [Nitrospira sp. LK70]|nr:Uma2 family endonuclease [Nitrospira sp. LK70]